MLKSIRLTNYKGFEDTGKIVFKPITILLGRNSSGKSSICKLLPILRDGLRNPNKPLPLISQEGVRLAYRYEDLFRNRLFSNPLSISMDFDTGLYLAPEYIIESGSLYNFGRSGRYNGQAIAFTTIRRKRDSTSPEQIPDKSFIRFIKPDIDNNVPEMLKDSCFDVKFIGPIRAEAPEYISKSDLDMERRRDSKGEYTYYELLKSTVEDSDLVRNVSEWLRKNMDGFDFQMMEIMDGLVNTFVPQVTKNGLSLRLQDVGEGITQVLPIITQSFLNEKDTITVLEQPALHLHPAIHAAVAERLAFSAKETGQRYVIESHSHNLLLGFQRMVANPDIPFNPEDIVIYFLDSDESGLFVKEITIDEEGTLSDWPTGVFEEGFELTQKIIDRK